MIDEDIKVLMIAKESETIQKRSNEDLPSEQLRYDGK